MPRGKHSNVIPQALVLNTHKRIQQRQIYELQSLTPCLKLQKHQSSNNLAVHQETTTKENQLCPSGIWMPSGRQSSRIHLRAYKKQPITSTIILQLLQMNKLRFLNDCYFRRKQYLPILLCNFILFHFRTQHGWLS